MSQKIDNLTAWCLTIILSTKMGVQTNLIPLAEEVLSSGKLPYPSIGRELETEVCRINEVLISRGESWVNQANELLLPFLERSEEIKGLYKSGCFGTYEYEGEVYKTRSLYHNEFNYTVVEFALGARLEVDLGDKWADVDDLFCYYADFDEMYLSDIELGKLIYGGLVC